METYDELAAFDQDFKPQAGRRPGLDVLPDGSHDFQITSAEMARTEKSNDLIMRLGLRVAASGLAVEHVYFFRTQQNVDILGSDLCTLGIDADQWRSPARPFSRELPAALPRLVGIRFRGKKESKPKKDDPTKFHHNLYVNQRIEGGAAPAAYSPDAASGPAYPAPTSSDIPF